MKSLDNSFNLVLKLLNLLVKGTLGISKNGGCDNVARNTASTTEISLFRHVDVNDVLLNRDV